VSAASHLLANLVVFTRLLRGLGLPVTAEQTATLAQALEATGLSRRGDVRAAARSVLVGRREHLEAFDRAFDAFFRARPGADGTLDLGEIVTRGQQKKKVQAVAAAPPGETAAEGPRIEETLVEVTFTWSDRELLRRKDFAELTPEEAGEVLRLMREQVFAPEPRRTRRRMAAARGPFPDPRRTLRKSLRFGGEPLELAFRRIKHKRRPLVVLCDVSGSMEPYSRMLLTFLYTLSGSTDRLEAFVFGTRLTRITRELRHKNVDRALKEAAAAVADWGGGTRIGECLRRFNVDWGRRVLGQGAVAVVISDGWDRGDPERLAREMERLQRSCERLIWLNPLLGSPGYEPLTRGIVAALPFADEFLPVHNLASLEQLARLLRRLSRRLPDAPAERARQASPLRKPM
jgi:uncharacterized protein with von Willebrand factor type A (vWA) domain